MKMNEFLGKLREKLIGLPQEDIERTIAYYREIIEDRMEDGLTEEAAVEAVGSVDEISSQIWEDASLSGKIKTKAASRRRLKTWEIVCLVLGAPVWLSLLIAVVAVFASLYIGLAAVLLVSYGMSIIWGVAVVILTVAVVLYIGTITIGEVVFGAGMCLLVASFALFWVLLSGLLTKFTVWVSKHIWKGIKWCVEGKVEAQ